jgi:hypothetical protein
MDLCAYVNEERRDGEGAVLRELSRLSLDTHRREVTGAHGTNRYTQKNHLGLLSFSRIVVAIICTKRLSSALLHMSGTVNTTGAANATDTAD